MSIPILILSDAPTSGTGLGRIARDLAIRIHAHLPEFRVGTIGYGGSYSRALGFPQYSMDMDNWVVSNLPEAWGDFAGTERGIVMTIWDASRMLWFARPEYEGACPDPRLKQFLMNAPFDRWGYFPIDATGPHDRLTAILKYTIEGYDRVLAYSAWAEAILDRTLAKTIINGHRLKSQLDLAQLPHGIDTSVFYPRNRSAARHGFGERIGAQTPKGKWLNIPDDALFIGIVATNQTRKDYGLGIQTVAEIAKERKMLLWIHTDVSERHWSLPCLLTDYGLAPQTIVTNKPFTDDEMAWIYSACDVTLGIGNAEGFGLPIFESLACGTPCIHGNDGGAPEHMPSWMLVEPVAQRFEGVFNCRRNVYRAEDWANAVRSLKQNANGWEFPRQLDWKELWPRWADWFKKGLL